MNWRNAASSDPAKAPNRGISSLTSTGRARTAQLPPRRKLALNRFVFSSDNLSVKEARKFCLSASKWVPCVLSFLLFASTGKGGDTDSKLATLTVDGQTYSNVV